MLEWITDIMSSLGYFGVVLLMFLENVFPPIPSEIIMPLAGSVAAEGELSLPGVIVAGTVGSILGALPLYFLGRAYGRARLKRWADKYGKWLTVSGDDIENAQDWFDRYCGPAAGIGRLVPGVRSLIAIPAGVYRIDLRVFIVYTAAGSAVWNTVLGVAGYMLRENFAEVDHYLGPLSYVVIGVIVVVYLVRLIRQHREEKKREDKGE